MSTTPAPIVAPKVSFLKKIGSILGKILNFVANKATPIADQAAAVAEILMPQFAPLIGTADSLIDRIAKQCIVTEAVTSGVGEAVSGEAKLQDAVAGIGPEIDAWVANLFPGAAQVSAAKKAGLVSAIADIVNEQEGGTVSATPAAVPPAA